MKPLVTLLNKIGICTLLVFLQAFSNSMPAAAPAPAPAAHGELADEPLVDIAKEDPTIVIDLRYAGVHNITGHPIYPPGTLCMVRRGVADRLKQAQAYLHEQGFGLKIWDAYRPAYVQQILWDRVKNPEVVADPSKGGSKHSWGVAVDVTLVDSEGHDVHMPTDFDDFTPAAAMDYKGGDILIRENLRVLKNAMAIAGFEGMRDEWWHFSVKNWRSYKAVPDAKPAESPAPVLTPSTSPPPVPTPVPVTTTPVEGGTDTPLHSAGVQPH